MASRSTDARKRMRIDDAGASLPTITAVGRRLAPHEDAYHWILTLPWAAFFGWVAVAYLVTNTIFAALYAVAPGCVANVSGFAESFAFSVQTLATIGYGTMTPQTPWAHAVVTVEALAGIVGTALITGITFARFARPRARILFSERAVICSRDGIPHLMFRMINWRRNQIAEAHLHAILLVTETTREGDVMRRPVPIKLERDVNPMFLLSWTALHKIDETSWFHGDDAMAKLAALRAEVFCTLTGFDETMAQTIHTRHRYQLDDIVPGARFVDILVMREDGTRVIDYDKFHDIVTVEGGTGA